MARFATGINKFATFSKGYVYYNRLSDTHPNFYRVVSSNIDKINNDKNILYRQAELLLNQATTEAKKDLLLLKEKFGVELFNGVEDLSVETLLTDQNIYNKIFQTINRTVNSAENYERNLKRMLGNNQKLVDITRFLLFPSGPSDPRSKSKNYGYITKAIENNMNSNTVMEEIESLQKNFKFTEEEDNIGPLVRAAIINILKRSIKEGLMMAFSSKDINGSNGAATLEKFNELIGNDDFSSTYIDDLYDLLKFDELTKDLYVSFRDSIESSAVGKIGEITDNLFKGYTDKWQNNKFVTGNISEIVQTALQNMVAKFGGNSGQAARIGQHGTKTDIVVSYDFPFDLNSFMEDCLKNISGFSGRSAGINAFKKIDKKLKELKSGYLIYQNAKNYSLNTINSFGGFSGGEKFNLHTYNAMLKGIPGSKDYTIIGAAAQLAKSEGGNKNTTIANNFPSYEEKVSASIATDMAYFLFDDFVTIGEDTMDVKVLHLFNLNGFYVPLSCVLYALSNSLMRAVDSSVLSDLVKVNITPATVLYDEGDDSGQDKWYEQRQEALEKTYIEINFLRNFKEMINRWSEYGV